MSYIEREAAIRAIENDCPEAVYYTKRDAIDCIVAQPLADVVEVRHGEWIEKPNPWGQDGSHTYVCSVCKEQISILGNALPYCSFCGAKMDGERREENEG